MVGSDSSPPANGSLRARLGFGVVTLVGALLALAAVRTAQQYDHSVDVVQHAALQAARQLVAFHLDEIEAARFLLRGLAEVPVVRVGDPVACGRLLRHFAGDSGRYRNLAHIAPNGDMRCSSVPRQQPVNIADCTAFRGAVANGRFHVGECRLGRPTDQPEFGIAYPTAGAGGETDGVVYAALDISRIGKTFARAGLSRDSMLMLADAGGRVLLLLSGQSGEARREGRLLPEAWLVRGAPGGVASFSDRDEDGRRHHYALASIRVDDVPIGTLVVGVPHAEAVSEVVRLLGFDVLSLTLVLAALGAAWWGVNRFVVGPLAALAVAARAMGTAGRGLETPGRLPTEMRALAEAYRDMTERLEERERRAMLNEVQTGLVFETAPDAMMVLDKDWHILRANRESYVMFGRMAMDLLGMPLGGLLVEPLPGTERTVCDEYLARVAIGSDEARFEVVGRRADGTTFFAEAHFAPYEFEAQSHFVLALRDIDARKQAERFLRESEARFRSLVELGSDWYWEQDRAFRFTKLVERDSSGATNRQWVLGKRRWDLVTNLDDEQWAEHRRVLDAHGSFRGLEYRLRFGDGEAGWHWVSVSGEPIFDEQGELVGYRGVARDITETKAAEERLVQAEKLEAIGQLTGGLAHDFNNLLGIVLGGIDLARGRTRDEKMLKHLALAHRAAERAAEVTRSLLAVARRQSLEPRNLDVDEVLREALPLIRQVAGKGVAIRERLGAMQVAVRIDPSGLCNAVINLVANARDAMRDGGVIMLNSEIREIEEGEPGRPEDLPPGRYLVVGVADAGIGMTPEVSRRAFEPFFTTKERGKGTGLGLAMVHGFVRQSGGTVTLTSQPGVGTVVRIYLPVAADQATATGSVALSAPGTGSEAVLFVDDEQGLCELAREWLEQFGYRVTTTADPREALACLEGGGFDLLLTDVLMPGAMNGFELAHVAHQRWPALRILLASGFYGPGLGEGQRWPLLAKPYGRNDLGRAIRDVLDGRRGEGRWPLQANACW